MIDILPEPKIIAFGGVPTGNMYAQLAAIAAGAISSNGCTPTATDNVAKIGKIIVAVAVLDVTSVKNKTKIVMTITIRIGLTPFNDFNCSPNHFAKPLSDIPLANAKPPPNKINTPHGSSFATSQSMIRRCFSVFLAGIINNNIDIKIAIVPSATDDVTSHFSEETLL